MSATYDRYYETFKRQIWFDALPNVTGFDNRLRQMAIGGVFGEYTNHAGDRFSAIVGLRGDWYKKSGNAIVGKFSPRLTLKYLPDENVVIRANGGRGVRYSTPLVDNIGVFSTGKRFNGSYADHLLEDAWTFGGNITYYLPFGAANSYLSLDYFRTQFTQQMIVDYEHIANTIDFYALDGGRSFTDNYQLDFSVDPVERFNITVTCRYTNAMVELAGQGLVEKPMTSRFKGVLNLQYATRLSKWIFDFTASLNGSCRVYNFMEDLKDADGNLLYPGGRTPMYPLLYAQVTRKLGGVDLYIGAENLTSRNLQSSAPRELTAT